ncbi:MAG: MFS transporter [Actinomycetota bacterium]|nr:MFS transporter [Actinomycetota bacterium]
MGMIKKGLELLKTKRDFRNLLGTQFLAQAGDGLVQAAIATAIAFGGQKGFDLEGAKDPDEILRIALYIFIPYTILSPFLGVVIDRWNRRSLLFWANTLRGVVVGVLGVLALAAGDVEELSDFPLLVAFLLTLSSTRVVLATKSAALPATLGEESLVEGNAVSQLGGALFQIGGVGVALIGKEVVGAEPLLLVGAIVYGVGALFALGIERAQKRHEKSTLAREAARVVRNIVAGLREVARNPKAGAAITTYFWLRLLWSFALVGIGLIARELLADDDLAVAALTGGAGAIGAVLGFILAKRSHERFRSIARVVIGSSVLAGGAVAVLGGLESKVTLAVMAFFLGFGFFLAKISLDTMVQEALGDDFRGRAFSLYDISYNLAWVLAAGAMKLAWPDDNEGGVLIAISGIVFLGGIALLGLWYRATGLLDVTLRAEPARQ